MGFALKAAICFALALAVTVSAQHAEDGVVPEATQEVEPVLELVDTSAEEAINAAAHQDATAYLQKAGSDACKALADSAEKAVKDNVKAEQAILDKIEKGAKCPDEGQDAVSAMKSKLQGAKDAQKKADKAYNVALNADVDFGKRKYNGLMKGSCGTFFNSQPFLDAEKKVNEAKKKKEAAKGKVDQAKKDLETAVAAAAVAVTKCQCNTFQAHQKALAAANAAVKAANTKSWTKAAHLKCVLVGTPASSCTVPAIPLVTKTSVAKGVTAGTCLLWDGLPQSKGVNVGYDGDGGINSLYKKDVTDDGWVMGAYMKPQISDIKDGPFQLLTQYNPHGARVSGQTSMIWGMADSPAANGDHPYTNMNFAFYCGGAGNWAQIYEKGAGKWYSNGKGMIKDRCKCGSNGWTMTKIRFQTNGAVEYLMKSNFHGWNLCRSVGALSGAKGPYMFDSSVRGPRALIGSVKLEQKVGNNWVVVKAV